MHEDLEPNPDVGLSRTLFGPQDTRELLPMPDFTAQRYAERLVARPFEVAPHIAVPITEHDRRADWLRAGRLCSTYGSSPRPTAHGLRASLLHQALEWPDLRRSMIPVPGRTGHPQMLIRFGYGPEDPASLRRAPHTALDDVMASR